MKQLVLENRQILLECECDFGIMHNTLSKLGTRIVDIDQIIHHASFLMQEIPPEQLHILSTLEESVAWSMYFEFPYFFQEHFQIKKSHIQLERPIKSLGTTITNISSQKDLSATSTRDETIKIWTIALCLFAMGLSMCSNEIETWQSLFSVAY
jgi:hypothetical protein